MLRTINLALIGLLVAGAGWTFMVKHNAEEAHDRVKGLKRQLAHEREEIDLLRADWALLNSPARLEQLVKRYNEELKLKNLDPEQIVSLDKLPKLKQKLSVPSGEDKNFREANSEVSTDRIFTGSIVTEKVGKGDRVVPANRSNSATRGVRQ